MAVKAIILPALHLCNETQTDRQIRVYFMLTNRFNSWMILKVFALVSSTNQFNFISNFSKVFIE